MQWDHFNYSLRFTNVHFVPHTLDLTSNPFDTHISWRLVRLFRHA